MKRGLLKLAELFIITLIFTGCKKMDSTTIADPQALVVNGKDKCRLVLNEGSTDLHDVFHYNDKGLVDRWTTLLDEFRIEYNNAGRMTKAKYYFFGEFWYTLVPTWENGRVVKETWYVGETTAIDDQAFFTYNASGQLIRKQTFLYDTDTHITYVVHGNAIKQYYYGTDGSKYYEADYTFLRPVKNPILTVSGLYPAFAWSYTDHNPWRNTSISLKIFQPDGSWSYAFDHDPQLSVLRSGLRNLAVYQNFYDRANDAWVEQTWTYEGCTGNEIVATPPASFKMPGHMSIEGRIRQMLRRPTKNMREELRQLMNEMK